MPTPRRLPPRPGLSYLLRSLLFLGASTFLSVLLPSGCGRSQPATVRIGLEGPMTGDYAYEGQGFERAVRLLVDQANASGGILGRRVELFVEDDRGDVKEASLVADRMASRGSPPSSAPTIPRRPRRPRPSTTAPGSCRSPRPPRPRG